MFHSIPSLPFLQEAFLSWSLPPTNDQFINSQLSRAINDNSVEEVAALLASQNIDVNWRDPILGWGPLHQSCQLGHTEVVTLLLAHPDIDVNLRTCHGSTPLMWACLCGRTACAKLLLRDARVRVNNPDTTGFTPLVAAAQTERIDILQWMMASGKELQIGGAGDAIDTATRCGQLKVLSLLESFMADPALTRHLIRLHIGYYDEIAAEIFAIVVFCCDGLVRVVDRGPAARFLLILRRLPLELQMVVSHRAAGSLKILIPALLLENAFRDLAWKLERPLRSIL